MKEFLSKHTVNIIEQYENAPSELVDGIEKCLIDKGDLEFLLGYTMGSVEIESNLKDKVKEMEKVLSNLAEEMNYFVKYPTTPIPVNTMERWVSRCNSAFQDDNK